MALHFFSPSSTMLRLGLGLGIGLSAAALHPLSPFRTAPIQCQYTAPYYRTEGQASEETGWTVRPNDPILQKQGRTGIAAQAKNALLTPENMRQMSLGSVLGLVAGVGLRAFSKALVVVLGMGIVIVEVRLYTNDEMQWAASKGYNILPLNRVQKYIKNADVRRIVSEKRPFKISFGATMAMAAFAQF